jgi:hypothetical protein
MALRVFYGFAKINNVMKKAELEVLFENGDNNPERNERAVNKWIHVVHVRYQTKEEAEGAEGMDRMFTKYGYLIDEKPFYGDIEAVLERNFQADTNHVSAEKRAEMRDKLRREYYTFYNRKPIVKQQLTLKFG